MLNLLKFIYQKNQISSPIISAKNDTDKFLNEYEISSVYSCKIDIDFKEVIYPDMVNKVFMGEWGEYIVSTPIYPKNNCLAFWGGVALPSTELPFADFIGSFGYTAKVKFVEYFYNDKKFKLFLIIPTYAILYMLFATAYRLYIISHLLSTNYLEQLQNTINYILHKSRVKIINVLSNSKKTICSIILNFIFYGNSKIQFT